MSVAGSERSSRSRSSNTGPRFGKFLIQGELARGSMGVIYRAEQPSLERVVALKILRASTDDEDGRARFAREARAAARVDHPNVVRVFDAGEERGALWLSMELVEGRSLKQAIAEGPLAIERSLEVAIACCRALEALAAVGIVHRDVKPENVLLGDDGSIKLADLGLARWAAPGAPALTLAEDFLGTPAYMPPEQARDPRAVDHRSDLWSLGATVYHVLHGAPPFLARTSVETVARLLRDPVPFPKGTSETRALEPVLRRLLEKEPKARFASAREARLAFEAVAARLAEGSLAERAVAALGVAPEPPSGRSSEPARPRNRRRVAARPASRCALWVAAALVAAASSALAARGPSLDPDLRLPPSALP